MVAAAAAEVVVVGDEAAAAWSLASRACLSTAQLRPTVWARNTSTSPPPSQMAPQISRDCGCCTLVSRAWLGEV